MGDHSLKYYDFIRNSSVSIWGVLCYKPIQGVASVAQIENYFFEKKTKFTNFVRNFWGGFLNGASEWVLDVRARLHDED